MSLTYEVVRTVEAFRDLRAEWTALIARAGTPSPFLTWEWMFTWWEHYSRDRADWRLAIVIGRHGTDLAAVLPGYIRRRGVGLSTYGFLGTEYESTDYLEPIESPASGSSLGEMLEFLVQQEPSLDTLDLSNILAGHPSLGVLERFARQTKSSCETQFHRVCPCIHLDGDWDTYLSGLSSNMRAKVRRSSRRLMDEGAEFGWVRQPAEVPGAVAELFALHARRFEAKEADTIFRAELRQPFHVRVSERFLERDILRLFRLTVKGRTIAALYCFEFGGVLYYFQAGIDPEWEKHSVGVVIMAHAIQYAFDRRLRMFDFMRGGEAYKFRWTQTTRELVVIRVGLSWRGRTALALKRQTVKAKRLLKRASSQRAEPATPAVATP